MKKGRKQVHFFHCTLYSVGSYSHESTRATNQVTILCPINIFTAFIIPKHTSTFFSSFGDKTRIGNHQKEKREKAKESKTSNGGREQAQYRTCTNKMIYCPEKNVIFYSERKEKETQVALRAFFLLLFLNRMYYSIELNSRKKQE